MTAGFWKDRPTLITGATGFMGSWLLKKLIGEQADLVVLVRDDVPRSLAVEENLLERVTAVRGTVEDLGLLRRTLAEYNVDTIFHLAAQPLVGVAKLDPLSTLETNVRGTWNVLEAARLCSTKQTVVASSDKAYGPSDELPYLESHPLRGRFPYDVSKSCADLISTMYAATYALPVCIVRCANLFGGGDLNFSRTIPGAIAATLKNERFVIRSDGKFVRDFLYVKDAAEAYALVAERLAADRSLTGEAFNFGLGLRLTVSEVVRKVLELMDRTSLEPIIMNQASAEIREQYLSSDKAKQTLGWSPRYDLIDGLTETIAWYRRRSNITAAFENEILTANRM
jgi:CDP-glucose 4,6-dehydratase